MVEQIVVERLGLSWAVKHNGGFLGFTKTREEAALIAVDLSEWISDQGREVTVVLPDPCSFIDPL